MAKFKKGDRVRIIQRKPGNRSGLHDWNIPNGDVGKEGIIDRVHSGSNYSVDHPTAVFYLGLFDDDDLELIKSKSKSKKNMASGGRFRRGEMVILVNPQYGDSQNNPVWGGAYGHIVGHVDAEGGGAVIVSWSNGHSNTYQERDLASHSPMSASSLTYPPYPSMAMPPYGPMTIGADYGPVTMTAPSVKSSNKKLDLTQLDSIVIEEKMREEIVSVLKQHKNSKKLFEEWGLGEVMEYGKGMTFMFYGPPGTGKTGMARCIAKAVGSELLVISQAEIQSSEPGAANRNIQDAFADARENDKVLFLDECDSLITSRNDLGMVLAGEVNTLLTEIEKFEGVCVLATNRIEHMDEALERRISLIVEFAAPNLEARKQIWKKLIPKKMPIAKDVDTDELSKKEITGGQIKNVVLAAARLALANEDKEVTLQHFNSAMDRVCASKNLMGAASRYRQGVMSDIHSHVTKTRSSHVDKKRAVDVFLDEQLKEEEGV